GAFVGCAPFERTHREPTPSEAPVSQDAALVDYAIAGRAGLAQRRAQLRAQPLAGEAEDLRVVRRDLAERELQVEIRGALQIQQSIVGIDDGDAAVELAQHLSLHAIG